MFNLAQQAALGLSQHHLVEQYGRLVEAEIVDDLAALIQAARADGIEIAIASSFRDFQRQSLIWNNKYQGLRPVYDSNNQAVKLSTLSAIEKCHKIMLFSALPGASRHHFGTDLDVYDKNAIAEDYQLQLTPDEYAADGPFYKLALWLQNNAQQYGFFLPYRSFNGGVAAEPWHISHIKRSQYYANIHQVDLLKLLLNDSNVSGWQCITANLEPLYSQYVTNINPV